MSKATVTVEMLDAQIQSKELYRKAMERYEEALYDVRAGQPINLQDVMDEVRKMLDADYVTPQAECRSCRYWVRDVDDRTGECHRNAPGFDRNEWCLTYGGDWCGEYAAAPLSQMEED